MDRFFKQRLVGGDSYTSIDNLVDKDDRYFETGSTYTLRYKDAHVEDQFIIYSCVMTSFRTSVLACLAMILALGAFIANVAVGKNSPTIFGVQGTIFGVSCVVLLFERILGSNMTDLVKRSEELEKEVPTSAPANTTIEIQDDQFMVATEKRNCAYRMEATSILLLLAIFLGYSFLVYGDNTTVCRRIRNFDDRENNTCNEMISKQFFAVLLIPIVVRRPRFMFFAPLVVVSFILSFVLRAAGQSTPEADTDLVYKLAITMATVVATIALSYHNELQFRTQFIIQAIHDARKESLRVRFRATASFVNKILPRRLKNRLLQTKEHDPRIVDVTHNGVAIVSSIHDVNVFTNSLLPTEAAVAISGLSSIIVTLANGMGLDHIKTVGDTSYVTCNLLRDCSHGAKLGVAYALALADNTSHLAVKSAIGLGKLVGITLGGSVVRYDIFGQAIEQAQSLAVGFNKRGVMVSATMAMSLPPHVLIRNVPSSESAPGSSNEYANTAYQSRCLPNPDQQAADPSQNAIDSGINGSFSNTSNFPIGPIDHRVSGSLQQQQQPAGSDASNSSNNTQTFRNVEEPGYQLRPGLESENFIDNNLKFTKKDNTKKTTTLPSHQPGATTSEYDAFGRSGTPAGATSVGHEREIEERLRQLILYPLDSDEHNHSSQEVNNRNGQQQQDGSANEFSDTSSAQGPMPFNNLFLPRTTGSIDHQLHAPAASESRTSEERDAVTQQLEADRKGVRVALDHKLFSTCCIFYCALSAILLGCIAHERWQNFDSAAIASIVCLIVCICGWLFCWILEHSQEALRMRHWLVVVLSVVMISGVSLSRPSIPGNDIAWLVSLLLATVAFSLLDWFAGIKLQALIVIAFYGWSFGFRPIVEPITVAFVPIQAIVLGLWIYERETSAGTRYENVLNAENALKEMKAGEEWRIAVLRATIPDPLVLMCREARLDGRFGMNTWNVGDVTVVSLQVNSFLWNTTRSPSAAAGALPTLGSNSNSSLTGARDRAKIVRRDIVANPLLPSDGEFSSGTTAASQREPSPRGSAHRHSSIIAGENSNNNTTYSSSSTSRNSNGSQHSQPFHLAPPGVSPNNSNSNSSPAPFSIMDGMSIASFVKQVEAFSRDIHEFFDKLPHGHILQTVKVFGGSILVAGPLEAADAESNARAASEAFKLIEKLLRAGHHFSAALAMEETVNVVQIADFPTFDMFGPAVTTAHALVVAAPTEMVVATEKLVNLHADSGDLSTWALKMGERERWRIRGKGSVGVHRITL